MRPTIIVFAKSPKAGLVKTRLIPRVGPAAACLLHEAFVEDTLAALEPLQTRCRIELQTDAPWLGRSSKLQAGGDLGNRILTALEGALKQECSVAMILGSDSPTVPLNHVEQVLACPADVCLGPASDGGFYAIACRKTKPGMFRGVAWSSPATLEQTIAAVKNAGLKITLAPEWYDVDEGADLDRLAADPGLRQATAKVLRSIL